MPREHTGDAHVCPDDLAAAIHIALLEAHLVTITSHEQINVLLGEQPVVRMRNVKGTPFRQLLVAVSDHVLEGRVSVPAGHNRGGTVRGKFQSSLPSRGARQYRLPS